MAYKYIAYDAERRVVKGRLQVDGEQSAKEIVNLRGYDLLALEPARQRLSLRHQLPTIFRVTSRDVITFSHLLATLVECGTTTLDALQVLKDHTSNPMFRDVVEQVQESVSQGDSLSEAMRRHPQAFPTMYWRMIQASEQTGGLEQALRQIAGYMEKERVLLSKVARALVYPGFVLLVAIGVVTLLMIFVVPSFNDLFTTFEGQMPLPTRILQNVSTFINTHILLLTGMVIAATALTGWALNESRVRRILDLMLLKTPMVGSLMIHAEMARFSRMVSVGLGGALTIPEIMDMAVSISRNRIVNEALENVKYEVLNGRNFSYSMIKNWIFPRLMVQVVKVGEETATLEQNLRAIAETYEAEVDNKVNTLVSIIEPSIMLFVGAVVAFIAISVVLPTYSYLESI